MDLRRRPSHFAQYLLVLSMFLTIIKVGDTNGVPCNKLQAALLQTIHSIKQYHYALVVHNCVISVLSFKVLRFLHHHLPGTLSLQLEYTKTTTWCEVPAIALKESIIQMYIFHQLSTILWS